ncbi:hypothetical protein TNCV_4945751 [Trichonephila clavipes]|nr:hypothetical protein TNCV_4945751 [Trichonephila clavipes]
MKYDVTVGSRKEYRIGHINSSICKYLKRQIVQSVHSAYRRRLECTMKWMSARVAVAGCSPKYKEYEDGQYGGLRNHYVSKHQSLRLPHRRTNPTMSLRLRGVSPEFGLLKENSRKRTKMPTEQEAKPAVVTPSLQQWRSPSTFRGAPGEHPLKWLKAS